MNKQNKSLKVAINISSLFFSAIILFGCQPRHTESTSISSPAFSPNDENIVLTLSLRKGKKSGIYQIQKDGTNPKQLTFPKLGDPDEPFYLSLLSGIEILGTDILKIQPQFIPIT